MSIQRRRIRLLATWFVLLLSLAVARSGHLALADDGVPRELGRIQTRQLQEISGIAASRRNPGILWVHDDGRADAAFAVTESGHVAARLKVFAEMEDLEDIAIGPGPLAGVDYLYLGDIGDNDTSRGSVRVARVAEPVLRGTSVGDIAAARTEVFRLVYPDGKHNAETLLVEPATGDLYIVTKEKKWARLYVARIASLQDGATVPLEKVATLAAPYASGGDISPDGRRIILRRESRGWLYERREDEPIAAALQRPPQQVPVRLKVQGQNGEAIGFRPDGTGYYTLSEGKSQPICLFSLGTSDVVR